MPPKVSVIMPVYNLEGFVGEALDSVLEQTFPDYEVIAVNDGSTDRSGQILEDYRGRFDGRLRIIHQANIGLAGARNKAIEAAQGEYLALLDADDKWMPKRLEKGVACLEKESNVGLVHSASVRITEDGRPLPPVKRNIRLLRGRIADRLILRQAHISCPTVMFRKECLNHVGLFDETLPSVEDRDLWIRVARKYRVEFIEEPLAYYRVREGSLSRDFSKMLTCQLRVIEKACQGNTGVSWILRRRARKAAFKEQSDNCLMKRDCAGALKFLKQALWEWPLDGVCWYNLIRSWAWEK